MRFALEVSFIAKNFGSVYIVKKSKNFRVVPTVSGCRKSPQKVLFWGIFFDQIFYLFFLHDRR